MAIADAKQVASVLAGDSAAFARLYDAYVRAVVQIVRDNVHDAEDVADTVQEVFLRALEQLPHLKDVDRFKPWLFSIARHAAIDKRRDRQRDGFRVDSSGLDKADISIGPEESAELRDLTLLVECCLSGLSPRDATAVSLGALGFSTSEVAEALGTTNGAAKVAMHRARQRLRDALTLELMVRRNGSGCHRFDELYRDKSLLGATRHIRTCPECQELARSDIEMYGMPDELPAQ